MPAIALVGAVASVSTGLALGGLVGGMMVAGGVMSGLGTITGNKKLARIGALVGLAGGIGAMATGASSAASSGLNSVGGEGVAMGSAAGNAGSNAVELGLTSGLDDVAGASGAFTTPVNQSSIIARELGDTAGSASMFGDYNDVAPGMDPSGAAAAPTPQTLATRQEVAQAAGQGGIRNSVIGNQEVGANNAQLTGALDKLKGFGKDALGYITDPKNAQIVKVGGGLVQGAMGAYSQQAAAEAQLAAQEAQRQRFNRSILGQYMYKA